MCGGFGLGGGLGGKVAVGLVVVEVLASVGGQVGPAEGEKIPAVVRLQKRCCCYSGWIYKMFRHCYKGWRFLVLLMFNEKSRK